MTYLIQSRRSHLGEWRLFVLFAVFNIFTTATAQFYVCNSTSPCVNGACCGVKPGEAQGVSHPRLSPSCHLHTNDIQLCGYDPDDQCSKANCVSNCDAKAECGKWAATAGAECPLNVCCSEFGFCGTTSEFCGDGCQSNCGQPTEPSCSSNDVLKKVIGYYESWSSNSRKCDGWTPDQLPAQSLTHLVWSFALFQPNSARDGWELYLMDDYDGYMDTLMQEFTYLQVHHPQLSMMLSVGG